MDSLDMKYAKKISLHEDRSALRCAAVQAT